MSITTLILGESGTGKSSSMMNLDPAQVALIQIVKKPLPFRPKGWQTAAENQQGSLKATGQGGNIYITDSSEQICHILPKITKDIIVIDDFQRTKRLRQIYRNRPPRMGRHQRRHEPAQPKTHLHHGAHSNRRIWQSQSQNHRQDARRKNHTRRLVYHCFKNPSRKRAIQLPHSKQRQRHRKKPHRLI